MARIRVNTDDLKDKAKNLATAADAFSTAGDEILAAAMSMPSYEGKLSGPARAAGYEIQRQSREVQASLSGDAESLRRTAQAFENVENQAVETLNGLFSSLAASVGIAVTGLMGSLTSAITNALVGVTSDSCGNALYGYERDPLTGTVTLYNYITGEKLVFTAEDLQNPIIADNVKTFKDNINAMNQAIIAEGSAAISLIIAVGAGLIGIVAAPTGVGAVAAWGVAAITFIGGIGIAVLNVKPLIDSILGCSNMWDALKIQSGSTPSGSTSPP